MESKYRCSDCFNHYKSVTYMFAYFYKAVNQIFEAIKQAANEAYQSGMSALEKMRSKPKPTLHKGNAQ